MWLLEPDHISHTQSMVAKRAHTSAKRSYPCVKKTFKMTLTYDQKPMTAFFWPGIINIIINLDFVLIQKFKKYLCYFFPH